MEGLPKDLRRLLRRRLHPIDGLMYLAACCPSFDPVPETLRHSIGSYCGKRGYFALLQYVHTRSNARLQLSICTCAGWSAAKYGHVNILEWLDDHAYACDAAICARAARGNQLETLNWTHARGYLLTPKCVHYAAEHGNLEMLEWLYDRGCIHNVDAALAASSAGRLHVLKWLYEQRGVLRGRYLCSAAATGGHLDVLKWLREIDCPWDETTTVYAATHNHLPLLQWAIANGCPFNMWCWTYATDRDHVAILRWGYESGHLTFTDLQSIDQRMNHHTYRSKVGAWLESLK